MFIIKLMLITPCTVTAEPLCVEQPLGAVLGSQGRGATCVPYTRHSPCMLRTKGATGRCESPSGPL